MELTDLARLPGAPDQNFEALTRAVVTRRYGALGRMRERRNQPGVEFYIQVDHAGALGEPGRVWGWSCKWFILGSKHQLSVGQRKQITASVDLAIKHVDGLTDFVLCLPQRPTSEDEIWINGLGRQGVAIRQWYVENYNAELTGHDELRSTFFGESALTPHKLKQVHERSVAPVQARWAPQLHTFTDVERRIDRALLHPRSFDQLQEYTDDVAVRTAELRNALDSLDATSRPGAAGVVADLERFIAGMRELVSAGQSLRPWEVRERLGESELPTTSPRALRHLLRRLRQRRVPEAVAVTGLAAGIRDIARWLRETRRDAEAPLLAVVAAAGQGKTHLAAQLTSSQGRPTAGVFLQGGLLRAGGTLDDLARRVPGLKVDRFEDLLEALDSAGHRAGCRIPLVIDGLNEAERPLEWRTLLAELVPALGRYQYVAGIVTLREALADEVLPSTILKLELEWARAEVDDILRAYFNAYLIDRGDAWLPMEEFRNPLFVRLYCEAANHEQRVPVGVEALPQSLIGVFELYRVRVVDRLAGDPVRKRLPADQIKRRLAELAMYFWTHGVRRIPSDDARRILDHDQTDWEDSLFRRLEEEGVLFREEDSGIGDTECGFVFDLLAGYLIADALLGQVPNGWAADAELAGCTLWDSLLGDDAHPLGLDVVLALIGLVPRRFTGRHLWRFAPTEHRAFAVAQELSAETAFLDEETVDELARLIATWRPRPGRRLVFDRLWELRRSVPHSLNPLFLDRVLRSLPVAQRDLGWTEWARLRAAQRLAEDVEQATRRWSENATRDESDDIEAVAVSWLLTSTDNSLRDLATKALQRYGRAEPKRLFDLAARTLEVDDPYVVERLVAAAFGAASTQQVPGHSGTFADALHDWLVHLRDRFLSGGATPTSHEQLRSYVRATYEFAATLYPASVPEGVDASALKFAPVAPAALMKDDDPNAAECDRTFGMDFENYVIGTAINGRANHDYDHPDYVRARAEIMARVWELGWREKAFGSIDQAIAMAAGRRFGELGDVERYGKKYGWIAYHEMIGRLVDDGKAPSLFGGVERLMPDIDPTFPDQPLTVPFPLLPLWAPAGQINDQVWVVSGAVSVPDELWSPDHLLGEPGGWILAEGYLDHRVHGRNVFGFFRTLVLDQSATASALKLVNEQEYPGNRFFPSLPTVRDVFAAEMPWSPRFALAFDDDPVSDFPRPSLSRDWRDPGIRFEQVAVEFAPESRSQIGLRGAYDVPSFDFAHRFQLRQLPGSVDLVDQEGRRASAALRAEKPWKGNLLFLRRDLVEEFAGDRSIVQVAWGEREVAVDWSSAPDWVRAAQRSHANIWRHIRTLR